MVGQPFGKLELDMRYISLLISVLLSISASAVDWSASTLKPSSFAIAEWVAGDTAETRALKANACGQVGVAFDADLSGTATTAAVSLTACADGRAKTGSQCSTTALSDGSRISIDTVKYPLLYLTSITAPGAGDTAQVRAFCQEQFSAKDKAPGVSGNVGTIETLGYIQGVTRVPFPEAIDPPPNGGTWTDGYVSSGDGGSWPEGSDSGSDWTGLTPDKAFKSWSAGVTWLRGGPYRRLNLDGGDTFTVANGGYGTTGFGSLVDADVVTTGCHVWPDWEALEYPCFWVRSGPGTGTATIDGTNNTISDDFMSLRTETEGANWLFENLTMICDSPAGQGNACIDTFDSAMATVVGVSMTIHDNHSTSGQIFSCHDASVTSVYGNSPGAFTGTSTVATNVPIGTQDACALNWHSSGLVDTTNSVTGTNPCNPIKLIQAGGSGSASPQEAFVAANPLYAFWSGLDIRTCPSTTGAVQLIYVGTEDSIGGDTISNHVVADFVGLKTSSAAPGTGTMVHFLTDFTASGGDGVIEVKDWYHTFAMGDTNQNAFNIQNNGTKANGDKQVLSFYAPIVENQRSSSVVQQMVRMTAGVTGDTAGSSITIADAVYDGPDGSLFWAAGSPTCSSSDIGTFATCVNAQATGAIVTLGTNTDITPDYTGTCGAASGTTTCVIASSPSWDINEWSGAVVEVTAGTNNNQVRRVASNTADTLTFSTAWSAALDNTSAIAMEAYTRTGGVCTNSGFRDGDCVDQITADRSNYIVKPERRGWIPRFMAGNTISVIDLQSHINKNAGRPRFENSLRN